MELILWRHAQAENGFPDSARRLTHKGEDQARRMAAWLGPRLPEHCRILVSPSTRTLATGAPLGRPFETRPELGPGAGVEDLLAAAGWPDRGGTALIVGHQPTLGAVAARLLAGEDTSFRVRKGAVWWFATISTTQVDAWLKLVIGPDQN